MLSGTRDAIRTAKSAIKTGTKTGTRIGTRIGTERLYKAPASTPETVDVPTMNFLMVDGEGDPNTSTVYQRACEALYGLSYTLKFALKKAEGLEYKVSPLEGLWWAEDMADFLMAQRQRQNWRWTMMIAQPPQVTRAWVEQATEELRRKKNPAALELVRFEPFTEGQAAQVMHVGPYSAEGPTIERLHAFIRDQGGRFDGRAQKHHEIYLSDPNRSAPERMKTTLRQPFRAG